MEPRDFFDKDLYAELSTQIQSSNIVRMIDANQNIEEGTFITQMKELGLSSVFER